MMLGGSPISVAVPPILDARICASRNGTGFRPRILAMAIAMGPTRRTVVTLSRNADSTAVKIVNSSIIFHGLPFAIFADLMAMNSNRPELRTTATNSIMPISTPMVLKSMYPTALSTVRILMQIKTTAPVKAATVRCTFSEIIAPMTPTKIRMDTICMVVICYHPPIIIDDTATCSRPRHRNLSSEKSLAYPFRDSPQTLLWTRRPEKLHPPVLRAALFQPFHLHRHFFVWRWPHAVFLAGCRCAETCIL